MSSTFDPSMAKDALKPQAQQQRRVFDERVFMAVERFELSRPGTGGEDWAIGRSVTDPSVKLAVRLSTVEERMVDMPKANEARLRQSYESGEFRRETLAEKAAVKIKLIAFDGARPLGETEHGVRTYRAHWPQTMAAKPEAEVVHGLGTINLFQPRDGAPGKASAHVEYLRTSTIVDGSNVREALGSALATKDDQGNARDGHAIMRVYHGGTEFATARVFPAREESVVKDPLYGDNKTVRLPVQGDASVKALLDGKRAGLDNVDVQNDLARAIVAGILDDDEPPVSHVMAPEKAANFFYGAKAGELTVEIVAAERINFGLDSAKTYLKDIENPKFAGYLVRTEVEGERTTVERGYGNTVTAIQRHPDGLPYAIYASPQEHFPQVSPLAHFDAQMPLTSILPEDPKAPRKEAAYESSPGM